MGVLCAGWAGVTSEVTGCVSLKVAPSNSTQHVADSKAVHPVEFVQCVWRSGAWPTHSSHSMVVGHSCPGMGVGVACRERGGGEERVIPRFL